MLVGDAKDWTARFRNLDVRFLERVVAVWPRCQAVLPLNAHEDTITINLVEILSKDSKARRLFHYLEFHYEPLGYTPEGLAYSKGQIDMAVLLDQERSRYLAYECKRLNVGREGGGTRSLATEYVKEGIVRFVTEKYAADLPIGCMLGYVMDGNVTTARSRLDAAIDANKDDIGLVGTLLTTPSIGAVLRLLSRHQRQNDGSIIEIRHALLPFT